MELSEEIRSNADAIATRRRVENSDTNCCLIIDRHLMEWADRAAELEKENLRLRELLAEPLSDAQIEVGAYELESGKLDYEEEADGQVD